MKTFMATGIIALLALVLLSACTPQSPSTEQLPPEAETGTAVALKIASDKAIDEATLAAKKLTQEAMDAKLTADAAAQQVEAARQENLSDEAKHGTSVAVQITTEAIIVAAIETAAAKLTLTADALQLQRNRLVIITGKAEIKDDEIGADEHGTLTANEQREVTPAKPNALVELYKCVGDEVAVKINLRLALQADNSVLVDGVAILYEGTHCGTADQEDSFTFDVTVPAGETKTQKISLVSVGVGGGDTADIELAIQNKQK